MLAVVDTGAHFTVFPQQQWKRFERDITWLAQVADPCLPVWLRSFKGALGGNCLFQLGTVPFFVCDMANVHGELEVPDFVAWFAYDNGTMPEALIGLSGGVFANSRLVGDYSRRPFWLEVV
jgi:hypothetical protein